MNIYYIQTHLIDAGFVWTEPHSKRIKVKLTIQQEVFLMSYLKILQLFFTSNKKFIHKVEIQIAHHVYKVYLQIYVLDL